MANGGNGSPVDILRVLRKLLIQINPHNWFF